jgi:hypothetical protein
VTTAQPKSFTIWASSSDERDFSGAGIQNPNIIILIRLGVIANLGECHAPVKKLVECLVMIFFVKPTHSRELCIEIPQQLIGQIRSFPCLRRKVCLFDLFLRKLQILRDEIWVDEESKTWVGRVNGREVR